MGKNSSLAEIAKIIHSHKTVVVISHYSPDPDAYGSSCGLAMALEDAGKKVVCVNEDGSNSRMHFIPGVGKVKKDLPPPDFAKLLVACDCGDIKRVGDSIVPKIGKFETIISIDHHASNDFFGHYNWVVPTAASTSELILDLLDEMKLSISKQVAQCLFYGLSADTGSFKYSSTTAKTFDYARRLLEHGADAWRVAQELYSNVRLQAIKLQAEAITKMKLLSNDRIAELVITKEMCERNGADIDDAEELKYSAQAIAGVELSAVIREAGDLWRISLRARDPKYDVSVVAQKFGGGGHKAAAAFRWKRPIDELLPLLRAELEAALKVK